MSRADQRLAVASRRHFGSSDLSTGHRYAFGFREGRGPHSFHCSGPALPGRQSPTNRSVTGKQAGNFERHFSLPRGFPPSPRRSPPVFRVQAAPVCPYAPLTARCARCGTRFGGQQSRPFCALPPRSNTSRHYASAGGDSSFQHSFIIVHSSYPAIVFLPLSSAPTRHQRHDTDPQALLTFPRQHSP